MFSRLVTIGKIAGSSLAEGTRALLLDLVGVGGLENDIATVSDSASERSAGQRNWGPLGYIARPFDPTDDGAADHASLIQGDGLLPFAFHDERIDAKFPQPKKGSFSLVHYGGGFISLEPSTPGDKDSPTDIIAYIPVDDSKAHVVHFSGGQNSLQLVHADGYFFTMSSEGIAMTLDGSSFLRASPGQLFAQFAQIALQGNVSLGANVATAIPLLPAMSTQPTPSVFFSPV